MLSIFITDGNQYEAGSLVRIIVDTSDPLGFGMPDIVAAMFRSDYFYSVHRNAAYRVDVAARYAEENIIMSGESIGVKKYIGGKAAMVDILVSEHRVVLLRGQTHGTYKLIS